MRCTEKARMKIRSKVCVIRRETQSDNVDKNLKETSHRSDEKHEHVPVSHTGLCCARRGTEDVEVGREEETQKFDGSACLSATILGA